jgi:ketosteroid isomerase-like protein
MPDEDEGRRIAASWIDAWNRRDLDAILAHYAVDATLISPLVAARGFDPAGVLRGTARLRAYFAAGLARRPDLRFALERVLVGVDGVAVHYRRERGGVAVEALVLDGEGSIVEARVYYDRVPDERDTDGAAP